LFSFLLARLHLERLSSQITLDAVRENLKKLPIEINETYDEIMERIEKEGEEKRSMAKTILSWVVFARRPLSVKEIKHALAVRAKDETLNHGRMPLTEDITAFCCGLVVLEAKKKIVRLVHYTAQGYFNDATKARLFPHFELHIALVCSTYLCMKSLEQPDDSERQISFAVDLYPDSDEFISDDSDSDGVGFSPNVDQHPNFLVGVGRPAQGLTFSKKLLHYPLLSYAGEFLGEHFRKAQKIQRGNSENQDISAQFEEVLRRVKQLITERFKRNFYCRLLDEMNIYFRRTPLDFLTESEETEEYSWSDSDDEDNSSLNQFVERLFKVTEDLESDSMEQSAEPAFTATDTDPWETPPYRRMSSHSTEASSYPPFGDRPAETPWPSYTSYVNYSPLHLAAFVGSPEVIEHIMSLDERPGVDELDFFQQSPLMVALKKGYTDVISVLLKYGATVDLGNPFGHAFLLYAAQQSDFGIVETILTSAVDDSNPPIATQGSSLPWYCQSAQDWISDLLFGSSRRSSTVSDVDSQELDPESSHTPKLTAVSPSLIQLLLEVFHCNVINLSGALEACDDSTPLRDRFFETAFFLAIERKASDVVNVLLQQEGINVNMRDYLDQTPLHRAASRNSISIVTSLLDNEAKVDLRDMNKETAWSANAYTGQGKEASRLNTLL
jgi:hypothetical protein